MAYGEVRGGGEGMREAPGIRPRGSRAPFEYDEYNMNIWCLSQLAMPCESVSSAKAADIVRFTKYNKQKLSKTLNVVYGQTHYK